MSAARQVWRMPAALGVLSAAGLVAGLLGDGIWDTVAVLALAVPLAVGASHALRPRKRQRQRRAGERPG
jgi:hypothetical protein